MGVGFALYKHSASCKLSRDRLYDIARETQNDVHYIKGRLDGGATDGS